MLAHMFELVWSLLMHGVALATLVCRCLWGIPSPAPPPPPFAPHPHPTLLRRGHAQHTRNPHPLKRIASGEPAAKKKGGRAGKAAGGKAGGGASGASARQLLEHAQERALRAMQAALQADLSVLFQSPADKVRLVEVCAMTVGQGPCAAGAACLVWGRGRVRHAHKCTQSPSIGAPEPTVVLHARCACLVQSRGSATRVIHPGPLRPPSTPKP